jgi:hypothetical protein
MWTEAAKDRYTDYHEGDYDWGFHSFHKANGYLANEAGPWLRGPYLHNGSVPTLRDCLRHRRRPQKFYRGYDLIDPVGGGFVSRRAPSASVSAKPYDTTLPATATAATSTAPACPMRTNNGCWPI